MPPDVPSYLSSQGTLSDRQEAVVRVDNQQPNGHVDSNGENQFNYFFCNAVSEFDMRREKSQYKVLSACYELSERSSPCNSPATALMQNKDPSLALQSHPLPVITALMHGDCFRNCSVRP